MSRNKKHGDKFNAPFATSLRQLIEDRKLTQGDIASITGVTRQTVSQYCNGISEPGYDTLIKISDYFNVSIDYLLGRTRDPNRQSSAIDELGLSPQVVDNLKHYYLQEDSAGFMDGVNMILTSPRLFTLAKAIDKISRNIALEKRRLEQFSINKQSSSENLIPTAFQMDVQDRNLSIRLEDIIEKEYPDLKGRVLVSCGRATLQSQMQDIVGLFRDDMQIVTGYIDCLISPVDEI